VDWNGILQVIIKPVGNQQEKPFAGLMSAASWGQRFFGKKLRAAQPGRGVQ
jgi:hypothetical protein